MKKLVIFLIDCYQKRVSPFFPGHCRFYPTCSEYMKQSIIRKGMAPGIFYGIMRILRCNPFFSAGSDPVR